MKLTNLCAAGLLAVSLTLSGCEQIQAKVSPKASKTAKTAKIPKTAVATPVQVPAETSDKPLGYLLDVNDARADQLDRVPGMTENLKEMILNSRPFLDMVEFDDELDLLEIPEKKRNALYDHLFMVIDINNGEPKDLQFVPNLSTSTSDQIKAGRPYARRSELQDVIKKSRQKEQVEAILPYFKVVSVQK